MTTPSNAERARFERVELAVCVVCLHLLANGEFTDGTTAGQVAAEGMSRTWGDNARHLVADGAELGFSTWPCDSCDNTDHGDRYRAVALIPWWG